MTNAPRLVSMMYYISLLMIARHLIEKYLLF